MKIMTTGNLTLVFSCLIVAFLSCNSKDGSTEKTGNDYCDTSKYRTVYKQGDFVLLESILKGPDSLNKTSLIPIEKDTATRMIRYYQLYASSNTLNHPHYVDFSYYDIFRLLKDELEEIEGAANDELGMRIYFGAYDAKLADDYRTTMPGIRNYMSAIIRGTHKGKEATSIFNLGNLCPPNCPGLAPDPGNAILFEEASRRTDVQ